MKHILVVIGLMVAALPCSHAFAHDAHAHAPETSSEAYTPQACHCHSCEDVPCNDDLDMPQELTVSSVVLAAPVASIQLFIFSETKPAVRQIPPSVTVFLTSIQTIQLLI